jgi:hypothetical protein
MASTYTPLGVELQATGENAGTWGTKTNTNLQLIEQITGGFTTQAVSDSGDTTLSVSDGSTGATLAHRVIEFTGSLTGSRNVTIPLDVQTFYVLKNSTSGSQNVVFKYATGSGDSITLAPGAVKMVYATANDGTNPDIDDTGFITASSTDTLTNKTLTSPKIGTSILDTNGNELALLTATSSAVNEFTIANAATGNDPTLSATGGDSNIDIAIKPKGTGETVFGTGAADATITSSGAHNLILDTNSGTNSGTITITDGSNGDIDITPNGTGDVVLAADTVKVGDSGAAATLTSNGAGTLTITTGGTENLILNTNSGTNSGSITITDAANQDILLTPNGYGRATFDGQGKIQSVAEKITVEATAATGTKNYDVLTQAVLFYTSDASGDWTLNIRGDGSTTLNSIMDTGESITVAHLVTIGSSEYRNSALQVDGSSVTPKYAGGSAPTEGNTNSIDSYVYTIIKTGDATFTALASLTQFA